MEIFVCRKDSDVVEEGFNVSELPALIADCNNHVWVDLEAYDEESENNALDVLGNVFNFHPLTIEDARETRNQPKIEQYAKYLFFIVHGVKTETNSANFVTKELDGYLGENYVITHHVEPFRSIDRVKYNLRENGVPLRRGADYLLHQVLDQLVDLYLPIVDDFNESILELEDEVFHSKSSNQKILEDIMDLRRSQARMKRITARQLEVLYRLSHGEFPQIKHINLPFYRDVFDHLQRISDLSENYKDLINSLFDIHFNVLASKTNDIVKFLTIFSAVILPLSLIAGVYGMNFENMPELHSQNGYFITIGVMIFVAVALLFYFWRKGWIFENTKSSKESDN